MRFVLLCASVVLVSLSLCSLSSCSNTVDIHVGVILDINSTDSPVGRIGLTGLSIARDDFYSQHADYKTRLVFEVRDSNYSVIDAAAAAIDLLKNVKVDAIIGPQKSTQVNFVMDLGDRAHVPIVSFSAKSPSLITRTPYFVQTVQSDANQVQAIASIVKAFKWYQVVVIHEDTEFGNGIMPYLSNALQDANSRVSYRIALPKSATNGDITQELYKLMMMQTRVFIMHMSQSLAAKLFLKARKLGMMKEGYAWIVTDGLTDLFNVVEDFDIVEAMQGVLGVQPMVPKSPELQSFSKRFIRALIQGSHEMNPVGTSIFALWAHDTFYALALAAERAWARDSSSKKNKTNDKFSGPFDIPISQFGPKLHSSLLETNFTGLAGDFKLVNEQLAQTSYQIVNIVGRKERQVGIWTPNDTNNTSKESFKPIIWPGDTTSIPRGWEVPVSGQKLKIGVPLKPGFDEFLKVEIDPETGATKVSGYYKVVFDAVLEKLPYALPQPDYFAYPISYPNGSKVGSYDGLVNHVSLQKYDLALGDISITANRSMVVDFSLPYADGGISGIVPIKYEEVNDLFTFFKPLTTELWIMTVVFYISTAVAIWIIGNRSISNSNRESPGEHAGMIGYFPLFPGQGTEANLLCLVLVTWALVASLLNSTYTASLASRLTVARLQPVVTDVTQLIKKGHFVGCQDGSFIVSYLLKLGFDRSKIKTYKSADDCMEALSLGSENGGISAFYDVMPHTRMLIAKNCGRYRMFGEVYRTPGFAFVLPKGSPIVADISRAIVQLTEKGIIMEIEQQMAKNTVCSSPDNANPPTRVTLRSFVVLFVVTGFVTLTCLIVLLLRFLHQKMSFCQRVLEIKTSIDARIRGMHEWWKQDSPSSCPGEVQMGIKIELQEISADNVNGDHDQVSR